MKTEFGHRVSHFHNFNHHGAFVFSVIAALAFPVSSVQGQIVESNFTDGADGWISVGNGGGEVVFSPTSGNPDGAISITDVDNGFAYFQAPAKFLVSSYEGSLTFDLKVDATGPDPIAFPVQVALEGDGLVLLNGLGLPTSEFQNFEFSLVETEGWRIAGSRNSTYNPGGTAPTAVQFQNVMNNLTGIFINADYTNGTESTGTTETATLDNVILTVPEPSSALLLLLGAGLLLKRKALRSHKQIV